MFLQKPKTKQELHQEVIKQTLSAHGFEFLHPIGKGGFASVVLVKSLRYNCQFVAKISEKGQKSESDQDAEISNLMQLSHPHIIQMYEYFTDNLFLYIILEYCPGGSLSDIIKSHGPLKEENLIKSCYQIITALKHCHDNGIAHQDLKPANVLLDKNNRCKLADFGISSHVNKQVQVYGGTRPYMAPELIVKSKHDPMKADLWALAVTFFELATGSLPWNASNEKEMIMSITMGIVSYNRFNLPKPFIAMLKSMFEVSPEKRASLDVLLNLPMFDEFNKRQERKRMNLSTSSSFGSNLNLLSLCSRANTTSKSNLLLNVIDEDEGEDSDYQRQCSSSQLSDIEDEEVPIPLHPRSTRKINSLAKSGSVLSFRNGSDHRRISSLRASLNLGTPTFA